MSACQMYIIIISCIQAYITYIYIYIYVCVCVCVCVCVYEWVPSVGLYYYVRSWFLFCGGGGTYSEHRFPALSSTDVVNQCLEFGDGIDGLEAICPFSGP